MGGMFQDGKAWYRHQRAKQCGVCGQVLTEELDAQVLAYLQRFTVPAQLKERIVVLAHKMMQAQARLRDAPPDATRIEELIPKIDRIADVIREGNAQNKKELFRTLFERIEQVHGQITRVVVRDWARPFFETSDD